MSLALDIYSAVAISAGTFFFLAGTAALLRFPDSLTRLHALTKADNLGLGFVVLGLLPRTESLLGGAKLVILWGLVQFSSAAVAQMIGSALRRRGAAVRRPPSSPVAVCRARRDCSALAPLSGATGAS